MENQMQVAKEVSLENIITASVKIPGVKVDRNKFLEEMFSSENVNLQDILSFGPIEAGVSREKLSQLSGKLIIKRTSQSSIVSFAAGIPGGLAMAATIPADVLQFFGMALRLAQELSYLYGAQDLWHDGEIDDERIKSQLIMYCGVMFGVSGAVSGVRVLSAQVAKTTLKKLPQKALTKTFWYPIVKQIGKAIGVKVTKTAVAQGVSKAIPIIGGVISGGLNFASMMPMAKRLNTAFDKACFDYSEEELNSDINEIERVASYVDVEPPKLQKEISAVKDKVSQGIKSVGSGLSGLLNKKADGISGVEESYDEKIEKVKKLKNLLDIGAITQEEFDIKKKEILDL
ncbi:MAG: SHOCT domain-containing protein [Acutalibacteraceae bacterium]